MFGRPGSVTFVAFTLFAAASCSRPAARRRNPRPTVPPSPSAASTSPDEHVEAPPPKAEPSAPVAPAYEPAPYVDPGMRVEAEFRCEGASAALSLRVDGKQLIDTTGTPLFTESECEVDVSFERTPIGGKLRFDVRNPMDEAVKAPAFPIDVKMTADASYLDAARVPFMSRSKYKRTHQAHTWPGVCYSPITGFAEEGVFVGLSLQYPLCEYRQVFSVRAFWNRNAWRSLFAPTDKWPENEKKVRGRVWPGSLAAGATRSYVVSVGFARADAWVNAFVDYKNHFRAQFGPLRYEKNPRPVAAISFGHSGLLSDDSPRGYGYRLDRVGWKPFVDAYLGKHAPRGWRRFMIWQSAGSYRVHKDTNMVFEIGTGWPEKAVDTAGELQRLVAADVQIGLWMGRATTLSQGFDSGVRWAIDVRKASDWELFTREIDLARSRGMRMLGMDDTHATHRTDWHPAGWELVADDGFFPKVRAAYPDMHLVVEPAASDFHNLWGSSFVWDYHTHGPAVWPEYLIPGVEINAVMKRGRMNDKTPGAHADPKHFNRLVEWGYVPLVFQTIGNPPFDVSDGTARE